MSPFHVLILLIVSVELSFCFDPLSGAATFIGLGAITSYQLLKCKVAECCTDDWISFDESKLIQSFNRKLFGQHLAYVTIHRSLRAFLKNKNPKKPLVMSFNGLTGSGKNFVATLIANSTYNQGMASSYVHLYSGVKDFPHKQKVDQYQDKLRVEIPHFTRMCERSLFIFDEVDKMPPGTLDALKPFIDYNEYVDGVNYRKNIFIFLSNAGSSSIVGVTLKFWSEGRNREEITMQDIEPIINKGAFNENGGFQFSELLRSELIDLYVPFLPLERKHVRKCVEEELRTRNVQFDHHLVNKIAEQLVYFPEESELYSKSGCKRITQKVDFFVDPVDDTKDTNRLY